MPGTHRRARASGAIARIEDACEADLPAPELLQVVTEQLERTMSLDAWFASATDPETTLMLGGGVVHGMPDEMCAPFWELEFAVPDYNKFADLGRAETPVADLHVATGGRPERSARYRELSAFDGIDAEMRCAFTAGGLTWGVLQLNRGGDEGFSADEVAIVERVAPDVGKALRRGALSAGHTQADEGGPGIVMLDADNRVLSMSPEARMWFARIQSYAEVVETGMGLALPLEILNAAQVARARATAGQTAATRTRLRLRDGAWALMHASCMTDGRGRVTSTAIVVERAKATDVAPLIVEAYELTPRELDVTRAVARGLSTAEIARELILSRYTVQDHLKRIYEKVGVATRGELVAKMFADHYFDSTSVAHV